MFDSREPITIDENGNEVPSSEIKSDENNGNSSNIGNALSDIKDRQEHSNKNPMATELSDKTKINSDEYKYIKHDSHKPLKTVTKNSNKKVKREVDPLDTTDFETNEEKNIATSDDTDSWIAAEDEENDNLFDDADLNTAIENSNNTDSVNNNTESDNNRNKKGAVDNSVTDFKSDKNSETTIDDEHNSAEFKSEEENQTNIVDNSSTVSDTNSDTDKQKAAQQDKAIDDKLNSDTNVTKHDDTFSVGTDINSDKNNNDNHASDINNSNKKSERFNKLQASLDLLDSSDDTSNSDIKSDEEDNIDNSDYTNTSDIKSDIDTDKDKKNDQPVVDLTLDQMKKVLAKHPLPKKNELKKMRVTVINLVAYREMLNKAEAGIDISNINYNVLNGMKGNFALLIIAKDNNQIRPLSRQNAESMLIDPLIETEPAMLNWLKSVKDSLADYNEKEDHMLILNAIPDKAHRSAWGKLLVR